ncbi:MAG: efflux transporter outer membrane subunit [Pseudomonadota bacterium]|nr:efflux transporter outer membrane subunit [Pseudomonadota bacterium]
MNAPSPAPWRARPHALAAALAALLTGCAAVGPNFTPPQAQDPSSWQARPSSAPALASTLALSTQSAPERWWTVLGDPTLDALQARLITGSPDLRSAALRFAQSRVQQSVVGSQAGPQVQASAQATRQRQSDSGPETRLVGALGGANAPALIDVLTEPYALYQAGFDASWELDLWGRVRRAIESADAGAQASRALLAQTHLALSSELARAWFALRLAQRQQALLQTQTTLATDTLALLQAQARHGLIAPAELIAPRNQLAELQAQWAPLQAQQAQLANQIGILTGAQPDELAALLAPAADAPLAAAELPELRLGLPADIRAAEARLHAATADIGVAMADLYPRIALGVSGGLQSLTSGGFGSWGARTWQIGPLISLPLFDQGRRRATVELRQLQQQEAAIDWHRTVLTAWQEVDDALASYAAERQRHAQLSEVLARQQEALALAQARARHGLGNQLPVLQAEQNRLQAQRALDESASRLRTALVAVYKAVGGGEMTPAR